MEPIVDDLIERRLECLQMFLISDAIISTKVDLDLEASGDLGRLKRIDWLSMGVGWIAT